jgi:hypothetical protein
MRLSQILPALLLGSSAVLVHAGGMPTVVIPNVMPIKDACVLLGPKEASNAVHMKVKMGVNRSGMCIFGNAQGSPVISIAGLIYRNANDAADAIHKLGGRSGAAPFGETVADVGDQAIFVTSDAGDITLQAAKGGNFISLSLFHASLPDAADHKAAMIKAANKALARF